jgi:UDP-2-acetamido-3-amino-2,3-dideoxy-glucuronate N-acetyltransferase
MNSSPAKKPVIAQVGLGYWGRNILKTLAQLDLLELYICDSDAERRKEGQSIAPRAKLCSDFSDVLKNPSIDAVVLATPVEHHGKQAIAALKAGKHVFVEKPVCSSLKEAKLVQKAARESGKHVMVGHIYIHHPAILELRNWIKSGKLGDLCWLRSTRCSLGPRVRTDVDVLWDYAIHDVYLFPFLVGEPVKRVRAEGRAFLSKTRVDWINFALEFPRNIVMTGYVTWLNPFKERTLMVVGSKGIAVFDELKSSNLVFYRCGYKPSKGMDKWGNIDLELFDEGKEEYQFDSSQSLKLELQHFIENFGTKNPPRATLEEGLTTLNLLEKLSDSNQKAGRWIKT